jgi:hypothetical protein
LSRVRVPIDFLREFLSRRELVACFLDVGSSYPGSAHTGFGAVDHGFEAGCTTPKGGAVRPLKGNVSWVQTDVSQVGFYLLGL